MLYIQAVPGQVGVVGFCRSVVVGRQAPSQGRKAVYEVIYMDEDLADCIRDKKFDIADLLKEKGVESLRINAFKLLEEGETSLDEVYPLLLSV